MKTILPVLLNETAQDAIDFAQTMIEDGLWKKGRSLRSSVNLERATRILADAEHLRIARIRVAAIGMDLSGIDAATSNLAHEISALAIAAIGDGSLRTMHFDPWRLANVVDADADARTDRRLAA